MLTTQLGSGALAQAPGKSDGDFAAIVILSFAIYFLPAIVASIRRHRNRVAIFFFNFFLGWTLVGGLPRSFGAPPGVCACEHAADKVLVFPPIRRGKRGLFRFENWGRRERAALEVLIVRRFYGGRCRD